MYSTLCTCPTAVRLCRSYFALRTGHIFFDMGSALMTTEMVMEQFEGITIKLSDAPIVEGAIAAAVTASVDMDLDAVLKEAHQAVVLPKL